MKKLLLFLLLTIQSLIGFAQNPADIDFAFEYTALNDHVSVLKIQNDGKILVGGAFTNYNNRLTRLNSDGSKDISFNIGTGFDAIGDSEGNIQFIEIQSDGKILVVGNFANFNGQTQNRIVRLNIDGSKDDTFNCMVDPNLFSIDNIAIQSDGKILVGGYFYGSFPVYQIFRLNSDGSIDTTFDTGTGFNDYVNSIKIQSDGKILVGGRFTSFNGQTSNRLLRLNSDGSKDTSFNDIGSGFNDEVYTILIQSDGKILVGGNFTIFKGVSTNRLVRLEINGSSDFMFGVGTGFDNIVRLIGIQSDGKILVGGDFSTYNGQSQSKLISLTSSGSKNIAFNIGTGFDNIVRSIAIQSDNTILVGGDFASYNGQTENRLISLNSEGSKNTTFKNATGFNHNPNVVKIQQDGKILVGGSFTTFNGLPQSRLIRLNSDGSKDETFIIGTGFSGFNVTVSSIEIQTDNKILVGGLFNAYNSQNQNCLIRLNLDGSKDTSFINPFFNNIVTSTEIQPDGKILVGGFFTAYNGQTQNRLIRLNIDGSKDNTFNIGTGFNDFINKIKLQSDGKILVGGVFTAYNGQTQNRLIRLNIDGSKDNTFNIGTGFTNFPNPAEILTIELQTDNKILVGGGFTAYNGQTQNRLIRLNIDGSKDNTFNIGVGFNRSINSLFIQSEGKILVGGSFTTYNGESQNGLILLNTDGSKDYTFNIWAGFTVSFMAIQPDGKIVITGKYEGSNFIGLMRLMGSSVLSTTDFSKTKIILYPNPTKDILNFTLSESISATAYEIYNLLGEKVSYGDLNTNSIAVSNLANGVYIVKINTSEGVLTEKFIKE